MSELPKSSQINLTSLLIFDQEGSLVVRGAVELDLFEDDFHRIASAVYGYLDTYGVPPGEAHIHDVLSLPVDASDDDTARTNLRQCLDTLHQTWASGVNKVFVLDQLENFIQIQSRKKALQEAIEIISTKADDLETPARFDQIMRRVENNALNLADTGINPFDNAAPLDFLQTANTCFPTGVKKLDQLGAGPNKKELHLFMALPGMGKSHWLVNLGLRAWHQGYRVLHISLEMSGPRVQQRYIQSALAIPSRKVKDPEVTVLDLDKHDNLVDIKRESIQYKLTLDDPNIEEEIKKALSDKLHFLPGRRKKLVVKEFPSGTLTVPRLNSYLESLEKLENFVPDLLILDYADLMNINSDTMRQDLDRLYVDLRGIASSRDMAVATASQSNRRGMEKGGVSIATLAEHFGKSMTADTVIAYNQTQMERRLRLARLKVEKCRNNEDKYEILISQRYETCQFVKESVFHRKEFQDNINDMAEQMGMDRDEIEKYKSEGTYVSDGGE